MSKTFPPTPQQRDFLAALLNTTAHLALIARAGCGKTSSILMAVDALAAAHPQAEIAVVSFNKAIADEVGAKLKLAGHTDWRKVSAQTLHGMGWGLVRFAFRLGNEAIDDKKVRKIVEAQNDDIYHSYGQQIQHLVRLAKDAGFGFFPDLPISNTQAWHSMANHHDVNGLDDTSEADMVIEAAQTVYRLSLADTATVDFADMILFPLVKNLRTKFTKDYIFGDEWQDMSAAKQALVRKFLRPHTGRLIMVGDDRQAIYGFAGADAQAMQNGIDQMQATVLPLSVTWRCPKAVVALAQQIVPDIEAAPTAPEGEVRRVPMSDELLADFQLTDAILCRNTAPLIEIAYKLIRAGKPCKVEGRQIGEGLIALAKRWKVSTTAALSNRLEDYRDREVQKAMAKGDESKVEAVEDKVATMLEIIKAVNAKGLQSVTDVINFISDLFQDDVKGVTTLCTYHRSKGREFPRVFLFEHAQRCPSKAARQPWQIAQEQNLSYVAITRSMAQLVFIG